MARPHVINADDLQGWETSVQLASAAGRNVRRKRLLYAVVIGDESKNAYEVITDDGKTRFGDLDSAVEFYNEV